MIRCRRLFPWALLVACAFAVQAPEARAAAEVHKLNLLFSSNPSSLTGREYRDFVNEWNRRYLEPKDLKGLDAISMGWIHEAELRYFVTPNVAIGAGVGQLRVESRQEYLPRISQRIELRTNVVSVPVHVGATYYLAPYNQGDFRARAYFGAGVLSATNSKVFFEQLEFNTDTLTTLGGSGRITGRGDAPGFYLEMGAHMWFATRLSVMLGATYRSMDVRVLRYETVAVLPDGREIPATPPIRPPSLDLGGVGVRFAVLFGL